MATNAHDESSPLLAHQFPEPENQPKAAPSPIPTDEKSSPIPIGKVNGGGNACVWTADGVPVTHGGVVAGEPIGRSAWDSGLFGCLGRNDELCGSDLEVCVLGYAAPCVLYGTNAERLSSTSESFASHCLFYTGLYLIGSAFFGGNCIAQGFAARTRTDMRHKFNLQGGCEALQNSCGCCGSMGEEGQERCEAFCDICTHFFCHPCALCQEGREVRRRLPHPGFNAQPVLVMIPPAEQAMGREA